jgi:hypothetical protein
MRVIIFFSLKSLARIFSYITTCLEILDIKYYDTSDARHGEHLDGLIRLQANPTKPLSGGIYQFEGAFTASLPVLWFE